MIFVVKYSRSNKQHFFEKEPIMAKRILVVDDEENVLNVVAEVIRRAGYEVLLATDGQEGLMVALENRPDLIVTDYNMPNVRGDEMCRMLRGAELTRLIPVILLTAREYEFSEADKQLLGLSAIVTKPFAPRELLTEIKKALGDDNLPPY
jgi:CheY-like chemotaxis protein